METLDWSVVQSRDLHLSPVSAFAGLADEDMLALEQAGEWLEATDELFISDGYDQSYLYQVVTGKVEVFKYNSETKKKHVLATLKDGAVIGEIAFLRGDVASANVKAVKKCILWRIDHATVQQYIAEYPGGAQFCLNLADVLAQRVQEGNTRLIGVSQSLSAYFGNVARTQQKTEIEAPQASGMADMEIPSSIYDMFVRHVYEVEDESAQVEDEHRAYVDEMVKSNQVDFVEWLEQGQREHKLKVILKFQLIDEQGRLVPDEEEAAEEVVEEVAEPTYNEDGTVSEAAPVKKVARKKKKAKPTGHIVSVPQVQARVKAHTAVIKEKPDRVWQVIHYGAYALLPFVTALTILKFLPLESRVSLADNGTYQAIPLTGIVDAIIFSSGEQSKPITVKARSKQHLEFGAKSAGSYAFSLKLEKPLEQPSQLKITYLDLKRKKTLHEEVIDLKQGAKENTYKLGSRILPAGKFRFQIEAVDWGNHAKGSILLESRH